MASNGTKMWITNGTIADVALVWAKTDDEMHGFLVERGPPVFRPADEGEVEPAGLGHLGADPR